MCGIAGIVYNEAGQAIRDGRNGKIARMLDAIRYRGPDGRGEYCFDRCALGHVRLSIIDIENGKQPMIRPKLGIVFNGEIYGYKEIKASLARLTECGGGGLYLRN